MPTIMPDLIATDGQTSLAGSSKDDRIYTGSADGGVHVSSGAGDDWVFAGVGADQIEGGVGNDILAGGFGNDVLSGGADNDILLGGAGNDLLGGGTGNDILSGGSGVDTFQYTNTGFGDDIITDFQFGTDRLNFYIGAVPNNDKSVTLSSVEDIQAFAATHGGTISAGAHNSAVLSFSTGDSITFLGAGDDFGTPYVGSVNTGGTSGNDIILGTGIRAAGKPTVMAHDVGDAGNDTVAGGPLGDNMEGDAGNDVLIGGAGNDLIGGQAGDDLLFGNAGNDSLGGGLGNDILQGDDGADTFVFSDKSGAWGNDTIADLNFGDHDALSLMLGNTATKVTTLAGLNSLIASSSATVSSNSTNDAATITFASGESIRLIGYGMGGGNTVILS